MRVARDVPDWRPAATPDRVLLRARLAGRVRAFFAAREVLEVQTPVLSQAAPPDVHLSNMRTRQQTAGAPAYYLQTSPEFAMKRLLAAGSGDIYQLCPVFRAGERGRLHNPEFTLLEWYRVGYDHHRLMDEVDRLLGALLTEQLAGARSERISYRTAVEGSVGLDPHTATSKELRTRLHEAGIALPHDLRDRDGLLDALISTVVGPALGQNGLLFLYDYPASQAAMARVRPGEPPVAERFEVYWRGIELANGFHELTDPAEQQARWRADRRARSAAGRHCPPSDERLLAAMVHGLPACAGVAVGFDRVVMLAAQAEHLDEVLAFPIDRA